MHIYFTKAGGRMMGLGGVSGARYAARFIFVVKQGVPSDEDLEWPYPSCLLYGKEVFRAFRSIAK